MYNSETETALISSLLHYTNHKEQVIIVREQLLEQSFQSIKNVSIENPK